MKTERVFQFARCAVFGLLVEILWFSIEEELVNSTAIIDHSNMLKPSMEVLILSVLPVPPEKHPTENGVIAGKY